MKTIALSILSLIFFTLLTVNAQNEKEKLGQVSFEHLRINVADKEATARWYVDNVGLEIIPSDNKEVVYVADKDHNFMIEFSSIPNLRTTYSDIHLDAFHLAFEGHKTIEAVAEKMLANKGVQEGTLYRNQIGDYVMNVRDPNGFTSQLIHRVNPFYPKPVKSTIRFEHFAYNTPDQRSAALWLVEFMDLNIPWSKDIDTLNNNFRNYRVPYVGDAARSMSLELFGKKEVDMTFAKMSHQECHIAFTTDDPEKLAKRMVYGGAKITGGIQKSANGDVIIDLRDPSGFPIRLIKRSKAILTK
ncbi:MAG: VOC family protein [Bacteroidales bacterium]|nr:VOC family protein [Bacteroidales bacterium]